MVGISDDLLDWYSQWVSFNGMIGITICTEGYVPWDSRVPEWQQSSHNSQKLYICTKTNPVKMWVYFEMTIK